MTTRASRYHPMLVTLHWALALLVIAALTLGALVMAKLPNSDPLKIEALSKHMAGGVVILLLMLFRLVVRARTEHPPAASTGTPALDRVAWFSHRMLYVGVIAMAGSGVFMALQAGLPAIVYGGEGTLPPDLWVFPIRWVHYGLSRLLMALIALHIAGALYHTLILKDGLLRRMLFGRRATAATAPARVVNQPLTGAGR